MEGERLQHLRTAAFVRALAFSPQEDHLPGCVVAGSDDGLVVRSYPSWAMTHRLDLTAQVTSASFGRRGDQWLFAASASSTERSSDAPRYSLYLWTVTHGPDGALQWVSAPVPDLYRDTAPTSPLSCHLSEDGLLAVAIEAYQSPATNSIFISLTMKAGEIL